MGFANMGMVMQALNSMANDKAGGTLKPHLDIVEPVMTLPTLTIIGTQTILKGVLSWLCYRRGSTSSIVIAMDLRNDIVTRMLALICAFIGDRFWRFADPLGAIIVWLCFDRIVVVSSRYETYPNSCGKESRARTFESNS
uniref:Transmembrane protein n=1 Tax=Heterorhabditis bacteriophora TaxID=37862 RepID=A0A1I7WN70_HETBA